MSSVIYHIAEKVNWDRVKAQSNYSAPSLDSEGFIHCSTSEQLKATYQRYYEDKAGLVLLEINSPALGSLLKWEESRAGEGNFPHVYGPIPKSAILDTYELSPEMIDKIRNRSL